MWFLFWPPLIVIMIIIIVMVIIIVIVIVIVMVIIMVIFNLYAQIRNGLFKCALYILNNMGMIKLTYKFANWKLT